MLSQGLDPSALALSVAFGICGGLFPIPMVTTGVCLVFIYLFKLNPMATQLVNLCLTPLQLTLMPLGYYLFSDSTPSDEAEGLLGSLSQSLPIAIKMILSWLVVSIVLVPVLYRILLPIMRKALSSYQHKI
uniref:DUF2062 domain-containing protein n=1 Tax=Arcella intermedia TaxID=1963864 RepID=A0A6B2LQM5_9EUKA